MRKKKLEIIESYIYAKTLNLISSNAIPQNYGNPMISIVENANNMSKALLSSCEEKLNKYKLNNISLMVLKKELESSNLNQGPIMNFLKICQMIKKYDYYKAIVEVI